jgi:hypothetical protein
LTLDKLALAEILKPAFRTFHAIEPAMRAVWKWGNDHLGTRDREITCDVHRTIEHTGVKTSLHGTSDSNALVGESIHSRRSSSDNTASLPNREG